MNAGSLEISLAADVARLREDMNKALGLVQRTARGFDDAAAQMRGALGGIGGGLSAAAFGTWIKSAIDFQDQLNDLNKTTDIAVSKLAGISLMSKQTGSDLTGMAQAMNKLTLEMGKAPEKFAKIGITAKDPLEAFKQLSDIFRSIEDPQLRAAVAAEALGKGWTSAAPALAEGSKAIGDMVTRGEELAGITKLDAEMADAFNDSMSELQLALMGTASNLAGDMLPLLTELVKSLTEVTASANNTETPFNILTETLRALIVIGGNVAFVIHGIAVEIGGMAAQAVAFVSGNFSQAAQIGRDMTADAERRRAAFDGWEQRMMSAGKTARGEAEETKRSAQTLSDAVLKSFVDSGAGAKKAADELKKLREEEQKFRIAWGRADAMRQGDAITQRNEEEVKAQAKAIDELFASRDRLFDQAKQNETNANAQLEAIQFETAALTMTNVEREQAIALRELERTGLDKTSEAYKQLAEDIKKAVGDRAALQQQISDFQNVWNSVDRTAQQAFTNIFEGGQDAFTKLRDTLKATLLDLLYQMTVRKWVFNLAANVTGASAGAVGSVANSSGLNSIGGLLGNFSGMSTANTVGSMFANATGGGLDALLATNGAFGTATGAGAGLMSGLVSALPYAGIALAVASFLEGDRGGPKTEGGADLAGTIQQQYNGIAAQLGITNKAIFEAFYSKDPQGDSLTQLRVAALSGGRNVFERPGYEDVGRSDAEFAAAVGDATMRAIIAALKDSDLSNEYKQYLNALADDASTADMQRAIDLIGQRKALDEEWLTLTSTDAENLARARKRELDAMDPTLRAIKERIWAEQDLRRESEATASMQTRLGDALLDQVRTAESAARDAIARQDAAALSLRRYLAALTTGPMALLSPEAQYQATRAEFMRLSSLSLDDPERQSKLEEVGTAFLEASRAYNASSMAYFTDLAAVRGAVEASQVSAQTNAELGRMELNALQTSNGLLSGILSEQQNLGTTFREAMHQLYAALAGANAVNGKAPITNTGTANAVVTGLYQTMLGRAPDAEGMAYWSQLLASGESLDSVRAAMQASAEYVNSQGGSAAAPSPSAPSSTTSVVEGLYTGMLGRSSDAEGLAYWSDRLAGGESLESVRAAMQASAEYVNRINGSHADGLWEVPFDGYRAELHRGERVLTASQARGQDAGNAEMLAELRGLRTEVARLTTVSASGMQANLGKQDMIISNTAASADRALLASVRGVEA